MRVDGKSFRFLQKGTLKNKTFTMIRIRRFKNTFQFIGASSEVIERYKRKALHTYL